MDISEKSKFDRLFCITKDTPKSLTSDNETIPKFKIINKEPYPSRYIKLIKCTKERKVKESNDNTIYNEGRWSPEEHQKFIENLLIHQNNWKKVKNYFNLNRCSKL